MKRADLISEIQRFWTKVDRSQSCWLWTGELNNQGYGRFNLWVEDGRERVLAHRLAYMLLTGEDIDGRVIRHDCDTPRCCNPFHLRIGTQADNLRDAVERNRANLAGLAKYRDVRAQRLRQRVAANQKYCSGCGVTKPLEDFHRNRRSADGRQGWCKQCRSAQRDDSPGVTK